MEQSFIQMHRLIWLLISKALLTSAFVCYPHSLLAKDGLKKFNTANFGIVQSPFGFRRLNPCYAPRPAAITLESAILTAQPVFLPTIFFREAIVYSVLFLYTSWLVSLYSGHARWRLPQPPPPIVGELFWHLFSHLFQAAGH
jgi:hypothetical protein